MMKLIILVVALAIGFGGGVWYSAHNPERAANIATTEQRGVLEGQLKFAQTTTASLDKMIAARAGKNDSTTATLVSLRNEQQQRIDELQKELNGK